MQMTRVVRWLSLPYGASALSLCLGLTVLVGWHTHNLALFRVHPSFVAMSYITALGFFLCGATLFFVLRGLSRPALVGGACVLAIGSLTLCEYLFGRDLGIDELFMKAYVRAGIVHSDRADQRVRRVSAVREGLPA